VLDRKLQHVPDLMQVDERLWSHFDGSLRYSSQALPINALLDTVVRPNGDTTVGQRSCVAWKREPRRAVSHVVLAAAAATGGQWTASGDDGVDAIGTLSYAEMLSLPGYSFAEHHERACGRPLPELERPSRAEVSSYFAAYPKAVGISDAIHTGCAVSSASRYPGGFIVQPFGIACRHLVLASGIHDHEISPPPLLRPLMAVNSPASPVLIVGSGFSAADAIISTPPARKIVHVYRWNPESRPSPLRGCHRQAYPEYAGVYRQMKAAALGASAAAALSVSPLARKRGNPFFNQRDWASTYEGLPNATVDGVIQGASHAIAQIRLANGSRAERAIGALEYHVGRRGSLQYLDPALWNEVIEPPAADRGDPPAPVSAVQDRSSVTSRTLRRKAEADTEVAPGVFVTGSLTGDTLVRHAYGACVHAAGRIIGARAAPAPPRQSPLPTGLLQGSGASAAAIGVEHEDMYRDRRRVASQ
jgi:hypothetical protein